MGDSEALDAMREAARLSPGNFPLRRLLADALLAAGKSTEAEAAYQAALLLAPGDPEVIIGLAESFVRQGKSGAALIALESLPTEPRRPARAGIVAAMALLGNGDKAAAAAQYQQAINEDAALADADMAARLGALDTPPTVAHTPPADSQRVRVGGAGAQEDERPEEPILDAQRSHITFVDVAGMEDVKNTLRMKLLLPIQKPELFAAYGKTAGGGLMLYGPPGAGKTHLARATAGELGADFIDVGLADILDMWVGSSERNLHSIFQMARRRTPCVLFFDEVDALASRRSDMRGHSRHVINQFLAELDGVDDRANEGILVLAATNAPWYVDTAFRRPGRFGEMVFVPPPDAKARAAILEILCRGKPTTRLDMNALAAATEGFVGADLEGVLERAIETKLVDSIRAGYPLPLTTDDLLRAIRTVTPTAVREWLLTARNYVLHANESGVWDELLPWLRDVR
ncbi:ATP-binding protein [Rhodococcus tibetensis]|uniref:ATP-binding protein n=1 Tax=Rhodococcus tibetensis TaxID=2965064 RepID=A0ABT1QGN5_9NOCA|nr:ATP-binding protein [Rhodococcus sp. FXJ9.536]MCQ4120945.1 ATP-binding protein [Rhodococcus sp. FXJ9.536]